MSKAKKTYTARFELDSEGYWSVVADLGAGRSAISDGQTLPKARRRIRQSIALLLDVEDENSFNIAEEFNLPAKATARLRRHKVVQKRLRDDEAEAAVAARDAARVLAELGISRRDAGDLLGLSGARIQQVLSE